ncbi:hypothetical protein ABPG74_013437 [Tetrahymena malaccensis]
MNKLTLFILFIFCSSVLADTASTCAALKSKDSCAANNSCKFTSTSSTCTNKCNSLSTADCALPANSSNCDVVGTCAVSTVCSGYTSKTDCQGQSACSWTEAVAATCSNNASIQSACNVKNQIGCQGDNKCTFVPSKNCSYKPGQCAGKTGASCSSAYCNLIPPCKSKAQNSCSTYSQADCTNQPGCSLNGSSCFDGCALMNSQDCAASVSTCQVTSSSCNDKSGDPCAQYDSMQCQSNDTFCSSIPIPQVCNANATYCSNKDPTSCAADANCIATPAVAGFCSNKVSASTCLSLATQSACSGNAGCIWNSTSCKNKVATSCQTTDNQATCTANGKFCDYTETGTCSAQVTSNSNNNSSTTGYSSSKSNSFSSILVFSLIAIIDLI